MQLQVTQFEYEIYISRSSFIGFWEGLEVFCLESKSFLYKIICILESQCE